MNKQDGCIHIYTGNGKGKTTAALGLALRAIGAGKKVFLGQFVKSMDYSEDKAIEILKDHITHRKFGLDCFIINKPSEKDIEAAKKGLFHMHEVLKSGDYDIIIFDEANIAIHFELFSADDLIKVLESRSPEAEIIITGRYAPKELIDIADLITEMVEVRHYYNQGREAKIGIEK